MTTRRTSTARHLASAAYHRTPVRLGACVVATVRCTARGLEAPLAGDAEVVHKKTTDAVLGVVIPVSVRRLGKGDDLAVGNGTQRDRHRCHKPAFGKRAHCRQRDVPPHVPAHPSTAHT